MAPPRPHLRLSLVTLVTHLITSTLAVPLDASQAPFAFALPAPASNSKLDDTCSGLPVANSTHSFWINTPGANPLAREGSEGALTGDADVCIVGAGITGVSAAYHLARAFANETREGGEGPVRAVVLEARDFCSGATGRNGGHLTPVHFNHFVEREQLYGREEAMKAYALEHYTTSELVRIIEAQGWQDAVDLVSSPHVALLVSEHEVDRAKLDFAAASAAGLELGDVEWLSSDEVQATYGASFPAFAHPGNNLWPLKLVTHLYTHARDLSPAKFNLTLHTNTPVTSISPSTRARRRWTLATPRGPVHCTSVLHAMNAYASALLPHLRGTPGIVPTRGQVLATRPAVPARVLTAASWGNQGPEYWFPRPVASDPALEAPLVILGGAREAGAGGGGERCVVDDSEVNARVGRVLRGFLPDVFPGRYEVGREPEMEWTGIMGYTKTGDPFVGPVLGPANTSEFEGQYISAGYTGHGMPRAFACAEAVAGLIVADMKGETETWTPPEWLPRHFLTTDADADTGPRRGL
ncbi:hypothetical protein H0H92_001768 [Tricholoma furcatifolium]|nr:hypothetical protein H0H92_001768 [Tricholoma furcatifolium]